MIKILLCLETNFSMSVVLCNMSLGLWCACVEHWDGRWQWRRSRKFMPMIWKRWRREVEGRPKGSRTNALIVDGWLGDIDEQGYMWRCGPCWPSQVEAWRTWWSDGRVHGGYMRRDHGGSVGDTLLQVGFVHKTTAGEFTRFGPQKPRGEFGVACDIIGQLASRQSYLMKSLWMSDAWISTWTILPLASSDCRIYGPGVLAPPVYTTMSSYRVRSCQGRGPPGSRWLTNVKIKARQEYPR